MERVEAHADPRSSALRRASRDRNLAKEIAGSRKATVAATPRLDGVDRVAGPGGDFGDADQVRGRGAPGSTALGLPRKRPRSPEPAGAAGRAKPCTSKSLSNAKAVTIPSRRMTSKLTWSTSEIDDPAARWAANAALVEGLVDPDARRGREATVVNELDDRSATKPTARRARGFDLDVVVGYEFRGSRVAPGTSPRLRGGVGRPRPGSRATPTCRRTPSPTLLLDIVVVALGRGRQTRVESPIAAPARSRTRRR